MVFLIKYFLRGVTNIMNDYTALHQQRVRGKTFATLNPCTAKNIVEVAATDKVK
jgi:hypothetical protein